MQNRLLPADALKFNKLSTLPAIFGEWQNIVYELLPENLKNLTPNGQSLHLSKEILGHAPGIYPYKTQEELAQHAETYSNNVACLLYETILIINQSNAFEKAWSQSYKLTLAAALTKKIGLKNLDLVKTYMTSLAEKNKWVPDVVNEKSFQLALVMRMVLSELLVRDMIPFTDKAIKSMVINSLQSLRLNLNFNLYLYESKALSRIDTTEIENTFDDTLRLISTAKGKSQPVTQFRDDLQSILLLAEQFINKLSPYQAVIDVLADWDDIENPNKNYNRELHARLIEKLGTLKRIKCFCELELGDLSEEVVAVPPVNSTLLKKKRAVVEEKKEVEQKQEIKQEKQVQAKVAISNRKIFFPSLNPAADELIHFDDEDELKQTLPHGNNHYARPAKIVSHALDDMLKKIKNYSSSAVAHLFNRFSVEEISLDIHALLKSILELLGENGKKNVGDAELLPILIEMLPNDKVYLLSLVSKMSAMNQAKASNEKSELSNYRAMFYVAIKTKVDILNNPHINYSQDSHETLKVILPQLDSLYKYYRNICRLKEATDNYMQYLDDIIDKEIQKYDFEDYYFDVKVDRVVVDEETGELQHNKINLYYLDAILMDYSSEEKNNRIKNIIKENPLFGILIEKYKVMSELNTKLNQSTVPAKDRLVNFHHHLRLNYKPLSQNRDSGFMTFLKVAGLVLSSVFLIVGWKIAYSSLFVSKGERFADSTYANSDREIEAAIGNVSKKRRLV